MSLSKRIATMSPLKLALAIRQLESKRELLNAEPIAIIGMGCRFPGADNTERLWELLCEGRDVITEVPPDRWPMDAYYDPDPTVPGKMHTCHGGFLDQVDMFDAEFFGISPREMINLDPQQRLLLEVAWEAIENANQLPQHLFGRQVGVFIGISHQDYLFQQMRARDGLDRIDAYFGSGFSHSIAAGRVSYILGLTGPSLPVNTACSSSLVALHLACQSLRQRECEMVLTGGTNLILSPEPNISLSKSGMLSPDGRCRTFDAAADGFVRSEGCGVVLLKRLTDAVHDGDDILALIRGSAVNQDGRSSGLTVPNGPSQQAVIRQALENGGVLPAQIGYVEAHGTGTSLGDPIEVIALGEVFGKDRAEPLRIGSVKTNMGHLESTAGIAGVIKTVLALQHEQIPPNLHFRQPNPRIPWEKYPLEVPTTLTPWRRSDHRRMAGVSAFGFSGTNVHVVLEEAPVSKEKASEVVGKRPLHLLTLSAKTPEALLDLAGRYEEHLSAHPESDGGDLCFAANTCRAHFEHRLCVLGKSGHQLQQSLAAVTTGEETSRGVCQGRAKESDTPPKIALLCTGQGSQYVGMGRQLYETQPSFRETLERCDDMLRPHLETPLLEVLYPASGERRLADCPSQPLDETAYTQPALFALEYALTELWLSWGIRPAVVMGHSVGEYVAACLAGVFSLEDGLRLIAERARLMQALPQDGMMVAVSATEATVAPLIRPHAGMVSVAAVNGPESVVLSGQRQVVEPLIATLDAEGLRIRALTVSHAFHSPLMEPMLTDFRRVAAEVAYAAPKIGLISNVTGAMAGDEVATPEYWCRHILSPVRFADGMAALHRQGCDVFVEIGPKPILLGMGRESLPDHAGLWLPSLREGRDEWEQMLQSLGELYVRGVSIDWAGVDQDHPRRRVSLPTYPFQRKRHWLPEAPSVAKQGEHARTRSGHPLLGRQLHLPGDEKIRFETELRQDLTSGLTHDVFDTPVVAATTYLEMALAAGTVSFPSEHLMLTDVRFQRGLTLSENERIPLHLMLTPAENETYAFQIFSLGSDDEVPDEMNGKPTWTCHVSGRISEATDRLSDKGEERDIPDLAALQRECTDMAPLDDDHSGDREVLKTVWQGKGKAIGQIDIPSEVAEMSAFCLHPTVWDAAFRLLAVGFPHQEMDDIHVPVRLEQLRFHRRPEEGRVWGVTIRNEDDADAQAETVDLHLVTSANQPIATLGGLKFQRTSRDAFEAATTDPLENWLYAVEWQPQTRFGGVPDYIPALPEIIARIQPDVADATPQIESYGEFMRQGDDLGVAYIWHAFDQLGWTWRPNQPFSTLAMAEQLGVVSRHRRLLGRLLEILAEAGHLRQTDDRWEVLMPPEINHPSEQLSRLSKQHPEAITELTLLSRCAGHLAEVLGGARDPLQLLFREGDVTTANQYYQHSPATQVMNTLVRHAVFATLERMPPGRGVRILEIGAGTGATTAHLLPGLPAHQTSYAFTDLSPLFTSRAAEKFSDYPFVRHQVLDIEQSPQTQGFDAHAYDIVVAANVLHATRNLSETLQHIRSLLAPGGMLTILEATDRQCSADLTFGLTEGWWRFTDHHVRPSYPLLPAAPWEALLHENGFTQAASLSLDPLRQAVILAIAPQEQPGPTPPLSEPTLPHPDSLPLDCQIRRQLGGSWLIFADESQKIGQQLAALFQEAGETAILVFPGQACEPLDEQTFRVAPDAPGDFHHLLVAVSAKAPPLRGVIHCWGLDATPTERLTTVDLEAAQRHGCASLLHLVQALMTVDLPQSPPLSLVTRGAMPVPMANDLPPMMNIAQSPLWGMGKAIALEHPDIGCVRIDLDPEPTIDELKLLFEEIRSDTPEHQIAYRDNVRHVARLVKGKRQGARGEGRAASGKRQTPIAPAATYLITGGLGGIGMLTAKFMMEQGAKCLVLTSRQEPSSAVKAQLDEWRQRWTDVKIVVSEADVSDIQQVRKLLTDIEHSLPPLRGIIHAAAVLEDGMLSQQHWESFSRVFAPKVQGAWHLHTLTRHKPLDFFVLFSGAATLLGGMGIANYVAANTFLDALAHFRHAQRLPAMSINWGVWSGVGFANRLEQEQMRRRGIHAMTPSQGVRMLAKLLSRPSPQVGVIPIRWSQFMSQGAHSPFFSLFRDAKPPKSKAGDDVLKRLRESRRPDEQRAHLIAHLQSQVAKVLGLDPSQTMETQKGFFEMGMDSLTAMELRNRLQTTLACVLPSTLSFKFPTVEALADYLATDVLALEGADMSSEPDLVQEAPHVTDAVAEVAQLSEDDLEDLINKELHALSGVPK